MAEIVGYFKQTIIDVLGLTALSAGTPIFLGQNNIEHMKNRHPYEFDKYFSGIGNIIAEPDYIGLNPSDESISFIKEYKIDHEYVKVAVRITARGKYFAKSLHTLSTCNAERYLERGTLIKLDK